MYFSPNITMMYEVREDGWAGHVAHMIDVRYVYMVSV
jgi:hypothetical protein